MTCGRGDRATLESGGLAVVRLLSLASRRSAATVAAAAFALFAFSLSAAGLPEGYTQLTYIQGNGTNARILADFTSNPTTDKIVAEVEFTKAADCSKADTLWCARKQHPVASGRVALSGIFS